MRHANNSEFITLFFSYDVLWVIIRNTIGEKLLQKYHFCQVHSISRINNSVHCQKPWPWFWQERKKTSTSSTRKQRPNSILFSPFKWMKRATCNGRRTQLGRKLITCTVARAKSAIPILRWRENWTPLDSLPSFIPVAHPATPIA